MACAAFNLEMGGNTPKASAVKKKIFFGLDLIKILKISPGIKNI